MDKLIPDSVLSRYDRLLEEESRNFGDDFGWLEEQLRGYPQLARTNHSSGRLPLRLLLERGARLGEFVLLDQHGAEHDILTAAAATNLSVVGQLLREDPQRIHQTDQQGNTPLHWACIQKGYSQQPCDTIGLVNLLLAAGADVDARNAHGLSPLDVHILDGNWEASETLFDHDPTLSVIYGVAFEDYEFLDELLDDQPQLIDWREPRDDMCLLHLALQCQCEPAMFEYLVARGASSQLESRFGRAASTPLLRAISFDMWEAAEALIRLGADVNAREQRTNSGFADQNCLQLVVRGDRIGLAEMLIENGANVDVGGAKGESLLCDARSAEMAELLMRVGVDPRATDDQGTSPLDAAISDGHPAVARVLVQYGVPPTFPYYVLVGDCERVSQMLDEEPQRIHQFQSLPLRWCPPDDGNDYFELPYGSVRGSALHLAAKSGGLRMVQMLLDRGANVNAASDVEQWTPLHDATYYTIFHDLPEGEAVIRSLVSAGADLHAKTLGGYRPLDVADYLSFMPRSVDIFDLLSALSH